MENKKTAASNNSPENLTLGMLINDVSRLSGNKMRWEGERYGMRNGYRRIMFHLGHGDDGGTQQNLVCHTRLSAPTVSVSLSRMEAEGLVRRYPDEHDQRVIRVVLTEKGKKLNDKMHRLVHEVEDDINADLTAEEIEQLKSFLRRIRQSLIEKGGSLDEKTR